MKNRQSTPDYIEDYMLKTDPRCGTCFWWRIADKPQGRCIESPPGQVRPDQGEASKWPQTFANEGCGKHSDYHPPNQRKPESLTGELSS